MPKGKYEIFVGGSSRDIRVEGELDVSGKKRKKSWLGRDGEKEEEEGWSLVSSGQV